MPLKALVDKFINTRFEPSGYTGHPAIRYAKSVLDYIGRWLGGKFISPDYLDNDGCVGEESGSGSRRRGLDAASAAASRTAAREVAELETTTRPRAAIEDAPYCSECGMLMTPNGSCYKCANCGSTSGCS